jgi:glycosyltransferase involved in cell wall biosynthesis
MNKLISTIIPVWNGEKYLAEAIESALKQDYLEQEIIVIDDGSTDNTASVAKQFINKIQYIYQKNKGLGASRNTGIKAAQGSYIAFLDSDDQWEKNKLSSQMEVMLKTENDPLIFGYVKQFFCKTLSHEETQHIFLNDALLPGYIAGALLLSKDRLQEVGPFIEKNQLGEFIEWYLRVLAKNIPVVMLEKCLLYRRIHQHNMGRRHDIYSRTDYLKILKAELNRRRAPSKDTFSSPIE